ncbi:MAG: DUF4139 domain-containing protein [Bacteroidetes bacterium]|nr:DUF4139 domain-containing protein [Bacteroidota bacterium]MBU1719175.1 DUF4139 domain-containing protein [Bacteroidota bacterium]
MKSYTLSLAMALFFGLCMGQNKEIETVADINHVTIYNSSAEIHYQKEIELPAGLSTIVFSDLTPFVVENTINIGTSSPDVEIITVTERINYTKDRKEQNHKIIALEDSITKMKETLGKISCKLETVKMEKGILFKDESIGGLSKGVSVEEIEKASTFFSQRYLALTTEQYELGKNEKELADRIGRFEKQISEISTNKYKNISEIQITVLCPAKQKVGFSFRFLTTMGGWAPTYDCKYNGNGNPIQFIFRANVFNSSGIDWDNVDITLSTASPTLGFEAPSFSSNRKKNMRKEKAKDGISFMNIEVPNAIEAYDIKHKYTIPSDSKPYLVDVNSYELFAIFDYLLIPKLNPLGFLMANIPDWNKINLIPGVTHVYNKGSYMGKMFLNTYADNDTLRVYLGKDNSIKATIREENSTNQNSIIGNYNVDKSEISITVSNNTADTFRIQLLDQVPVISGDKAKLNFQNIEQAIYDKREGLLTWNFVLNPGEKAEIVYGFEIKVPKTDYISNKSYRSSFRRYRNITCPSFN